MLRKIVIRILTLLIT